MDTQPASASFEKKTAFILSVLEAAEKRRDAAENKASILLASNAIVLTAITSLGISSWSSSNTSTWMALEIALIVVCLVSVALSCFWSIRVLAPILGAHRREVMKISSKEFNVFFSVKIAGYQNAQTYVDTVTTLTEDEIFEQLATQAYNLSRIIVVRYNLFIQAHQTFLLAVITFVALTLVNLAI